MSEWMTKREVAAHLKVSLRTVSTLDIPHIYVGRLPRYSTTAVKAWEIERTIEVAHTKRPRRHAPGPKSRVPRRSAVGQTEAEIEAELRAILARTPPNS